MKKVVAVLVVGLVGAVGYWLISSLFFDTIVEEEIVIQLPEKQAEQQQEVQKQVQCERDAAIDSEELRESETASSQNSVRQGLLRDADPTHLASGSVFVSGQNISFVNLDSTRVPDGRVYLANDLHAQDFVDVGRLKGNKGNQNYTVSDSVNTEDYKYVLIWCRAFSVLVGSAELK